MGKDIPYCHAFCCLFDKEHIESYDWGYAKVVDMVMCLVVRSWVGGSGNVEVLLEALSFPFMRVRNALHGYIVYK